MAVDTRQRSCRSFRALMVYPFLLCNVVVTYGFVTCSWKSTKSCVKLALRDYDEFHKKRARLPQQFLDISVDTDKCPSRPHLAVNETNYWTDWGVEHHGTDPHFPQTVNGVADAAFEAIAGTLYGKQRLDPNIASNAMTPSIFGYRPVRAHKDNGRIGVEIDGASYLFARAGLTNNAPSDADATRRVALALAMRLSQKPWPDYENENTTKKKRIKKTNAPRPVAVYFNTVKQALVASQELQMLKESNLHIRAKERDVFESISIHSMGHQDAEIPKVMHRKRGYRGLFKGKVDPTRGLVLVVQPTDYNDEFRPPGPAVGAISSLQRLVARAATQELPMVVLSPRFLEARDHGAGWEQSGYQQSATFGGAEPPKGPTPWLMRDFSPPVFCWVGNALSLSQPPPRRVSPNDHTLRDHYYSRVALTQSVMDEGHSWHMFAAEEAIDWKHGHGAKRSTSYKYLASTKTSSGRPTRDIIRLVYSEWS